MQSTELVGFHFTSLPEPSPVIFPLEHRAAQECCICTVNLVMLVKFVKLFTPKSIILPEVLDSCLRMGIVSCENSTGSMRTKSNQPQLSSTQLSISAQRRPGLTLDLSTWARCRRASMILPLKFIRPEPDFSLVDPHLR